MIRFPHWLRLFVLFVAADIVISLLRRPVWTFDLAVYAAGLAMSLGFFYALDLVYRLLPRALRIAWTFLVSFVLAFLLVATYFVFEQFGEYISQSMLRFIVSNPSYFAAFLRTYLFNVNSLGFLVLWGLILWVWVPRARPRPVRLAASYLPLLVVVVAVYFVGLNQIIYFARGRKLPIDTSCAVAAKRLRSVVHNGLYRSERLPVAPIRNASSCNVILLINESFGKRAFPTADSAVCPMPFLREWTRRESGRFFVFPTAFTNSGATDISVPSILSGVAPWEQSGTLHTMPLVWDWAAAAGYRTAFVSAQQFSWANLDDFFRSPGPDLYLGGDQTGRPLINDTGIDEIAAMQLFCDSVLANPARRPFCAVYNSNALHTPGQTASDLLPDLTPAYSSRYCNSAAVLDRAIRLLCESLASHHLLDSTFIIITADHGDTDSLIHSQVHRLYNFYDEIMNIPFLVYVPAAWLTDHPDRLAALRENEGRVVANLDILPTILAAIGANCDSANAGLRARLNGASLFAPLPPERNTVALNTNDIRQWEHEGFGIFRRDRRFVYSDIEGPRWFDAADRNQTNDLWPTAPPGEKRRVLDVIDSIYHLRRMFPAAAVSEADGVGAGGAFFDRAPSGLHFARASACGGLGPCSRE